MRQRAFCHNCGADIALDEPIRIDHFSMIGDAYPLCYKGKPIPLTNGERTVAWSIMKAFPSCVKPETILDRLDSTGSNNSASVLLHRVRKKIEAIGAPDPIQTVFGHGYRWKPGGGDEIAAQVVEGDKPVAEILRGIYDVPPA